MNVLATLCRAAVDSLPLNSAMVAHTPRIWKLQSWLTARQCASRKGLPEVPADHAAMCAPHALHGLQGSSALTQLA